MKSAESEVDTILTIKHLILPFPFNYGVIHCCKSQMAKIKANVPQSDAIPQVKPSQSSTIFSKTLLLVNTTNKGAFDLHNRRFCDGNICDHPPRNWCKVAPG